MFKEDELPAWFQYTTETVNGIRYTRNRAEGEGAHDGIDGTIFQRNSFPRNVQKFYVELRSLLLWFGQPNHTGAGFKRVHLAHFGWIVEREVHAQPYTNLKNFTAGQGSDSLTNLANGSPSTFTRCG